MNLDDLARIVYEAAFIDSPGVAREVARAVVLTLKDDIELGTSRSRALDAAKARTRLHALIADARQEPS